MAGGFSFSFSGDDIENTGSEEVVPTQAVPPPPAEKTTADKGAFPVEGKPQIPADHHDVTHMLSRLPSKIVYSLLDVDLGQGKRIQLPRRELFDVRVQLAAEDDELGAGGEDDTGLGNHDVRSGIYEGGFKSWESSVDLVKVLSQDAHSPMLAIKSGPLRMIELGCGTALPSLAVFQWAAETEAVPERFPLSLTMADYNPSVLYLVTLPNFVLTWALSQQAHNTLVQDALSSEGEEGELELSEEVKTAFQSFLETSKIRLSFVSGGWSPELVELLYSDKLVPSEAAEHSNPSTLVIGAETIYSPFALSAFAETLLEVLRREQASGKATSIVAAKRLYFGVGGSLDDFVDRMTASGTTVSWVAEETEGVRRGVVQCSLP
ncbi:hypothetical protein PspLS_03794 [Pyricularia sp. CBS 133598]|nr:hypothetical protein PspLS_03794 [Pyricularia sp. CBS 133598]